MSLNGTHTQVIHLIDASPLEELVQEVKALRSEVAELRAGLPPELRGMLSLEQLAAYLGVRSEQTARAWCCRQGIRLRKVGSATRVLGSDVHAALSKK